MPQNHASLLRQAPNTHAQYMYVGFSRCNLANRQTDRHRGQSHLPPPLSAVIICTWNSSERSQLNYIKYKNENTLQQQIAGYGIEKVSWCSIRFKLVTDLAETMLSGNAFKIFMTRLCKAWLSRAETVRILQSFIQFPLVQVKTDGVK